MGYVHAEYTYDVGKELLLIKVLGDGVLNFVDDEVLDIVSFTSDPHRNTKRRIYNLFFHENGFRPI